MSSERRKHPRVALRSRCWCETDGVTVYARLVNASEGGVFIGSYAPLPRGAKAHVRFPLGSMGHEVVAEATVVWVREPAIGAHTGPGMGLQFTAMDSSSLGHLREFVSRSMAAA